MKKFMLVLFVVAVAAAVTWTAAQGSVDGFVQKACDARLASVERVEVYAKGADKNYTYTATGAFNIYASELSAAGIIVSDVDNILGAAVYYDDELSLDDVLEAYDAVSLIIQSGEDCVIVYGYSDGCGKTVSVDGKKVNVQIVLKKGRTVVGSPLIMGSY